MKKNRHAYRSKGSLGQARTLQPHAHSNLKWLLITAICVAAFFCVIGVASAAQLSGSPGAAAHKDQAMQKLIDAGRAHMQAKPGGQHLAPAAQPAPARQAGIVNMHQGPFSTHVFTVHNFWQGPVGSDWLLAYAGAKTNADETQGTGGIVLYTETVNSQGGFDLHPAGTFLAPKGTTPLTVTGTNDNLLLLRDQGGAQLTFDLATHQFH